MTSWILVLSLAACAVANAVAGWQSSNGSSYVDTLPANAKDLFEQSMAWMDAYYDPIYGYLYAAGSAYRHETRSSAYYAVGLLARNEGDDVEQAERIINNIVGGQFKDPADQWYGTYQKYPEEPTVGAQYYEPSIYDTWDPNWRGFVGSALIIGLEEFGHLLSPETTTVMHQSLWNNSVGDSYRVGGVDDDNLYPAYSNPSIMRALVTSYTGHLFNDSNMTSAGETYASDIIELFDRADTLSEFNSGTYTGVSVWALTLWSKYSDPASVMHTMGPVMLQKTWDIISQIYHPGLKNLAGPWDRGYGFDQNKYLSIIALHFWTLLGKQLAPIGRNVAMLSHVDDFSIGPLVAVLSPYHDSFVNSTLRDHLTDFAGEHTVATSAYSPPWDYTGAPRNITIWLAENITIGGESFIENVVGGPAINPTQFNPAVIQWKIDAGYKSEIGVITLHATEEAIDAVASPGLLNISYPSGNSSSTFQLVVTQMASQVDVSGWSLPNLDVEVGGNVDRNFTLSFNTDGIKDFIYWNFTYAMPEGFTGVPNLSLKVGTKY